MTGRRRGSSPTSSALPTWSRGSLRPERIRVAGTDGAVRPGEQTADGEVVDVVYAGATTRYVVTLDVGPLFVVVEPAGGGAPTDPPRRGARVRLTWDRESVFRLG